MITELEYLDAIATIKQYAEQIKKQTEEVLLPEVLTKTPREIPNSKEVKQILDKQLIAPSSNSLSLIFPSPRGKYIDTTNLQTRHWKPIILKLIEAKKVKEYLSFNHTRHTFINHCLEKGISINQVAYWVGNSPKTILDNYVSIIKEEIIPTLY